MKRTAQISLIWPVEPRKSNKQPQPPTLANFLFSLGIKDATDPHFVESLPFSSDDTTAGSESELQAAVIGQADQVDLPLQIRQSSFYANIINEFSTNSNSRRTLNDLDSLLTDNPENVWENSWVRIPLRNLNTFALRVVAQDLRSKRGDPNSGLRNDVQKFLIRESSREKILRVPISYLLKLTLAQLVGSQERMPKSIFLTAQSLMDHFVNDNCSPETISFYVSSVSPQSGIGFAVAREKSKRFLLTHVLLSYANECFNLAGTDQKAIAYFSPHSPTRQRKLNDCISDSFYRELFTSPCLSGWNDGENKHKYMHLCHKVLSRSQLNAIIKLRDARINTNNLIVLPNTSNISLSNNGTHVSLGSIRLKQALEDPSSGISAIEEKYYGDLVIKLVEHFLPLFVGTYTAAPFRHSFSDFHPEKVLGFLPHELDSTHLRFLWTNWKQKAKP